MALLSLEGETERELSKEDIRSKVTSEIDLLKDYIEEKQRLRHSIISKPAFGSRPLDKQKFKGLPVLWWDNHICSASVERFSGCQRMEATKQHNGGKMMDEIHSPSVKTRLYLR